MRKLNGRTPRTHLPEPQPEPVIPPSPPKKTHPLPPDWLIPMTPAQHMARLSKPVTAVMPAVTVTPELDVTHLRAYQCHVVTRYEQPACLTSAVS